jgi:hypothetical protein
LTPNRDRLDAVLIFPSMPEVMRLNKVGSFTMANLGQSKSVIGEFMKKKNSCHTLKNFKKKLKKENFLAN